MFRRGGLSPKNNIERAPAIPMLGPRLCTQCANEKHNYIMNPSRRGYMCVSASMVELLTRALGFSRFLCLKYSSIDPLSVNQQGSLAPTFALCVTLYPKSLYVLQDISSCGARSLLSLPTFFNFSTVSVVSTGFLQDAICFIAVGGYYCVVGRRYSRPRCI